MGSHSDSINLWKILMTICKEKNNFLSQLFLKILGKDWDFWDTYLHQNIQRDTWTLPRDIESLFNCYLASPSSYSSLSLSKIHKNTFGAENWPRVTYLLQTGRNFFRIKVTLGLPILLLHCKKFEKQRQLQTIRGFADIKTRHL